MTRFSMTPREAVSLFLRSGAGLLLGLLVTAPGVGAATSDGPTVLAVPAIVTDRTASARYISLTPGLNLAAGEPTVISGGAVASSAARRSSASLGPLPPAAPPSPLVGPSLLSSFETMQFIDNAALNGGFLFIPPDDSGAVSSTHAVLAVNCAVQAYTKAGVLQAGLNKSLQSFFTSLSPLNPGFDPKVLWDQYAGRFVIVSLERTDTANGDPSNTSHIFLAVSATSDPTGAWFATSINSKVAISAVDRWADYPGFAVDAQAVYINANMFGFGAGGTFGGVRLWVVDKGLVGGFYSGGAATISLLDPYAGAGSVATTTQPAHVLGTAPAGMGTYLVSYSGLNDGTNEFIQWVRLDTPLTTPTFTFDFVSLGAVEDLPMSALAGATQSGTATTVNTNDRRALNAVWRNNTLWLATTMKKKTSTLTNATWVKLAAAGGVATLSDFGQITGADIAANAHTFFPSIAVDGSGNAAIGFSASAPTIFPGSYFTGRFAGDAAGTNRGSAVLRAGTDFYVRTFGGPRNRWGDYSSTVIDPSDDSFWVFNQHAIARGNGIAPDDGQWKTAFGHFSVATLPVSLQRFTAE